MGRHLWDFGEYLQIVTRWEVSYNPPRAQTIDESEVIHSCADGIKMYRELRDATTPFEHSPANERLLGCRWAVDLRGDTRVRTAWKENVFVKSEVYSNMMSSVLLRFKITPSHGLNLGR